ncbi:MAG: hypothetical protein R3D26_16495 [Cyanobacteriota/Melainabacteria group bacterium]
MAASFPDADAKSMSTDSAPVDMAPGDSDRSSGYVNPNASASEVGAAGRKPVSAPAPVMDPVLMLPVQAPPVPRPVAPR